MQLVLQVFDATHDFTMLDIVKPLLSFLDPSKVSHFLTKTAPSADTQTLLNSVDLFTNPAHVCLVFDAIRARSVIDVMAHGQFHKLRTAVMKMTREFFDERVAVPFDDFAFLCSIEAGVPISSLCWDLLSPGGCVSVPCLFLAGLRLRAALTEFVDSLLALVGKIDPAQVAKCLVAIGVFMLVGLPQEPFRSVRLHFEAAPREIDTRLVLALLPSLFAASPAVRLVHIEPIEAAPMTEHSAVRDEVVECLRLKRFGNIEA
jgi:hypothetical protein